MLAKIAIGGDVYNFGYDATIYTVCTIIGDGTTVDGEVWSEFFSTAMEDDYKEGSDYNELISKDRATVDALIKAQTEAGEGEPLVDFEYPIVYSEKVEED